MRICAELLTTLTSSNSILFVAPAVTVKPPPEPEVNEAVALLANENPVPSEALKWRSTDVALSISLWYLPTYKNERIVPGWLTEDG